MSFQTRFQDQNLLLNKIWKQNLSLEIDYTHLASRTGIIVLHSYGLWRPWEPTEHVHISTAKVCKKGLTGRGAREQGYNFRGNSQGNPLLDDVITCSLNLVFDLFALPLLHHHLHHLPSLRAATLQCLSQSNNSIYRPMQSLESFHAAQIRSREVRHCDEIQFCTDLVKFCQICVKQMCNHNVALPVTNSAHE